MDRAAAAKKSKPEPGPRAAARTATKSPPSRAAEPGASALRAAGPAFSLGLPVQAKLTVGEPDDPFEREAHAVSDQVAAGRQAGEISSIPPGGLARYQRQEEEDEEPAQTLQRQEEDEEPAQTLQRQEDESDESDMSDASDASDASDGSAQTLQRQEDEEPAQTLQRQEEDEEPAQLRRDNGRRRPRVTPEVESRLRSEKSGGKALPDAVRGDAESRFDRDFSGVRIHTESAAAGLSRSLNAQAFTHGSHIFFAPGKFEPHTEAGRRLLSHELTHVAQQGKAPAAAAPAEPSAGTAVQREEDDDRPTPEQRAAALRAAAEAAKRAQGHYQQGREEITEEERERAREAEAGRAARNEGERAEAETPAKGAGQDEAAGAKAAEEAKAAPEEEQPAVEKKAPKKKPPRPAPRRAEAKAGAGEKKPAEETDDRAPASPEEDPAFQATLGDIRRVSRKQRSHDPAERKVEEAHAAAESPKSELVGHAQSNQVDAMETAEAPAPFDRAVFKAKLMERIAAAAPKTLEDADNFKEQGALANVKESLQGQVSEGKARSRGPLATAAQAPPKVDAVEPRPFTPLAPPDAGRRPGDVGAARAVPKPKGASQVEAPLAEGRDRLAERMAEEKIDDDLLARSNEPQFLEALDAKQQLETHAEEAPQAYRGFEQERLAQAEEEAAVTAQSRTRGMFAGRSRLFAAVGGRQGEAKKQDETERDQIAHKIQGFYQDAKTQVEKILGGLDGKVESAFDEGAARARQIFENYVDEKMTAYKEERYGGWFGWARWGKDKIFGMPDKVNDFYKEGRRLYVNEMDAVIDGVIEIIATAITAARAEVKKAKKDIADYVENKLPDHLKAVGRQAAEDIQDRFDDLESDIDSKQDELITTLAEKYTEGLQEVDARIEEMKEENKGYAQKAWEFGVGVAKAIWKLKDLLFTVLARISEVVLDIVSDPIGFLGKLAEGMKLGFENFLRDLPKHLQKALVKWLTGALGGIEIPEDLFSLPGIFSLVLQVLNLTKASIRARAVELLGEPVVSAVETLFEPFMVLVTEGPVGLWKFLQDKFQDLKERVIDQIQQTLISEVLQAGVKWILSLLTPASAFIKAAMTIYKVVKFFIERLDQLSDLITSVIDAVGAFAKGTVAFGAKLVEEGLIKVLPLLIGLLATILGVGGLAAKVRGIVQAIGKRVDRAIRKLIQKAAKYVRKLFRKGKVTAKKGLEKVRNFVFPKHKFKAGDEVHTLFFEPIGRSGDAELMIASKVKKADAFLKELAAKKENKGRPEIANAQAEIKKAKDAYRNQRRAKKQKTIDKHSRAVRKALYAAADHMAPLLQNRTFATKKNPLPLPWYKPQIQGYPTLYFGPKVKSTARIPQSMLKKARDGNKSMIQSIMPRLTATQLAQWRERRYRINIYQPHHAPKALPEDSDKLGVTRNWWPVPGKEIRLPKTAGTKRTEQIRVREKLRDYGYYGSAESGGQDMDHVMELQLGGADSIDNLWPLDSGINQRSGRLIAAKTFKIPGFDNKIPMSVLKARAKTGKEVWFKLQV